MSPAWKRMTMPSAFPFLRSGWSVAIVSPDHSQREEWKTMHGLYPSLMKGRVLVAIVIASHFQTEEGKEWPWV